MFRIAVCILILFRLSHFYWFSGVLKCDFKHFSSSKLLFTPAGLIWVREGIKLLSLVLQGPYCRFVAGDEVAYTGKDRGLGTLITLVDFRHFLVNFRTFSAFFEVLSFAATFNFGSFGNV